MGNGKKISMIAYKKQSSPKLTKHTYFIQTINLCSGYRTSYKKVDLLCFSRHKIILVTGIITSQRLKELSQVT